MKRVWLLNNTAYHIKGPVLQKKQVKLQLF